jgi:ABC-2 type transport system permease protein
MLWYKAWLETRWRFLIGLAIMMCSAAAVVFTYHKMLELLVLVPGEEVGGELGRRIREAATLAREYRGYVWSQGFGQNLTEMGTLFAVLLGTGGLHSGRASLFTLSLPASRKRLLGTGAAAGLAEWSALAIVPSLLIVVLSPAIGERYAVSSALAHAVCLFAAGAVFFSLAVLMSTAFPDLWRPLLITLVAAIAIALVEEVVPAFSGRGLFSVMSGETYFRTGQLPWGGLLVSGALSAALLYGASANFSRRDF